MFATIADKRVTLVENAHLAMQFKRQQFPKMEAKTGNKQRDTTIVDKEIVGKELKPITIVILLKICPIRKKIEKDFGS